MNKPFYLGTSLEIPSMNFNVRDFNAAIERAMRKSETEDGLTEEQFYNAVLLSDILKGRLSEVSNGWYSWDNSLNISWVYDPVKDIFYIFKGSIGASL